MQRTLSKSNILSLSRQAWLHHPLLALGRHSTYQPILTSVFTATRPENPSWWSPHAVHRFGLWVEANADYGAIADVNGTARVAANVLSKRS